MKRRIEGGNTLTKEAHKAMCTNNTVMRGMRGGMMA